LLVQEHKRDSGTQARYLYTTDLSLSEEVEEACRVGDRGPPRDVKALGLEDSSFWRRLQGHLTIFTVNNVVRELVGEPNLRSVEAFLRFVERHLGGPPGLMRIFKLR
jgi:putative transposase